MPSGTEGQYGEHSWTCIGGSYKSTKAQSGGGSNKSKEESAWYDIGCKTNTVLSAITPYVKSSIGYLKAGAYSFKYYARLAG